MGTKEQEIKAIKSLIEMDGYFAEYFKADLEKMVENIKNDFPIEIGTHFNASAEYQMQRADKLVEKHAKEVFSICETMLCVAAETGNARLYERATQEIGINNVIKLKRLIGLDLDCKEIDYLISQLK